jgi:hypothetical protein
MTKKIIKEILKNERYKRFELKINYKIKSSCRILFNKYHYITVYLKYIQMDFRDCMYIIDDVILSNLNLENDFFNIV